MGIQTIEIEEDNTITSQDPNNKHNSSKEDKYTKNELVFVVQIFSVYC